MKDLKILIAGLANAGKTSILRVLDNNLEKIPLLKPTQGVEQNKYNVLGLNVIAWDLGGQVPYRQKYLKEYRNYFSDAVVMYYVIDIQDEAGFKESSKYLKDILDAFEKMEMRDVYVAILLHKYDTHIQIPSMATKISNLKESLTKLLANTPSVFFETSIYDPYSVFQAISDGILQHLSGRQVLHQKIKEFGEELNAFAALIISNKGYVYGAWHSKDVEIIDLGKFNRAVFGSVRMFMDEENDSRLIDCSDQFHSLVVSFKHKEHIVLFCLMLPRGADMLQLKEKLQQKRKELPQILNLLAL